MFSVQYAILEFIAIIIAMLIAGKFVQIPVWKRIVLAFIAILCGAIGTKLMSFIEEGQITGGSFFGAVFFSPFLMALAALLLRVPVGKVLDMCAPGECAVLAAMKLECLHNGCCGGILLHEIAPNTYAVFPSQIVESIVGLLLAIYFCWFIYRKKAEGRVYFHYMIYYGICRFILNFFRAGKPVFWVFKNGHLWSVLSILIGVLALTVYFKSLKAAHKPMKSRKKVNS